MSFFAVLGDLDLMLFERKGFAELANQQPFVMALYKLT